MTCWIDVHSCETLETGGEGLYTNAKQVVDLLLIG